MAANFWKYDHTIVFHGWQCCIHRRTFDKATVADRFSPTPLPSKLMYNEAFRANQFLAGIKPIFVFNDMFQFRSEFYGFVPIFPIKKNALNKARFSEYIEKFLICPFGGIKSL